MARTKPKSRKDAATQSAQNPRPDIPDSKPSRSTRTGNPREQGFPIVGIGASAGGLEAFTRLLKHLPLDTGLGFVVVQHLDPQHESALTQLLKRATSLGVREVTNNARVEPNNVYVIPPNTALSITHGLLKLKPRAQNRGAHHPIDSFFESLAQDQGPRAIGVILSGTATDGTLGLEAIKAEGGITFAQDDSAKYDSMPRSAVAAGCVDFVLSPENISKELARIAKHPYVTRGSSAQLFQSEAEREADQREGPNAPLASGAHGAPRTGAKQARAEADAEADQASSITSDNYKKILLLLRKHCGVDFSLYKSTTIQRRITRRMVLNRHNTLREYAQSLGGNFKELDALYSDCLISVTSFFRNPEMFQLLESKVFPKLLQQRSDEPLRVWVVGCSTGQEAYSIAMAFQETSEKLPRARKLQVFATDLNEALLEKARQGLYAKKLAEDVSPERLRRFFNEEDSGYRVIKPLRDMVVFARQNLISDPPFSRMDLVSCRNLLIYLEPSLQKEALPTFHYALKPEGFLLLGASESIGGFSDLFEPVDRKHKLYARKTGATQGAHLPAKKEAWKPRTAIPPSAFHQAGVPQFRAPPARPPEVSHGELNAQREADRLMVKQFAPPSVLINADLQILQFSGPTSAWLEPPTGKASFDVLKMAREGLMLPLRAAIHKAKKENKTVRRENVRIEQNGQTRTVNLQVVPLKNLRERCFLILFEQPEKRVLSKDARQPRTDSPSSPSLPSVKSSRRNAELERELAETRDCLQAIQEQNEASNEELQASNEEVQSANEELQSINEELETAKEELESSNEELTTVNEEMASRNTELSRLSSDLLNFQTSTNLGLVLLGRDLTIRRFSSQAEKQFNLRAGDVGRHISSIRHSFIFPERKNLSRRDRDVPASVRAGEVSASPGGEGRGQGGFSFYPGGLGEPAEHPPADLESLLDEVIATVRERQCEVRNRQGRWFSLRARPYFTLDHKVDGAVLVVVDIDDLKRIEEEIRAGRDYAEAAIRTARDPLVVLNADLSVEKANDAFYKTFKVSQQETENKLIYELAHGQWDIPKLRVLLEEILPRNTFFNDFEVSHDFQHIGLRTMLLNARRLDNASGQPEKILLGIQDVTERLRADQEIRLSEDRFRSLVLASAEVVWTTNADGLVEQDSPTWRAFTGQTFEQYRGAGWLDVVHPDDRESARKTWAEAIAQKRAYEIQYRLRAVDGSYCLTTACGVPLLKSDGSVREWIAMNTDITAQKRAEEALRESKTILASRAMQLEQLVAERTGWLQDTISELEHFSYTITHDMRAPLRAMQGFGTLLLSEAAGQLTPRSADHLRRISSAASRMDALIRDSLQYARIVREHIPLTPVEPGPVLAAILESYPTLQPPQVEIQMIEPLPAVIANETGLSQCFSNLLVNAIKFVKPGVKPKIRIWAEERGERIGGLVDNWIDAGQTPSPTTPPPQQSHNPSIHQSVPLVRFWIEDNGIGIPRDYQRRIFQMFQQLDKSYEGTGIGLALVRKTAQRMNGQVGVESEPGKGSRFWLEFAKASQATAKTD